MEAKESITKEIANEWIKNNQSQIIAANIVRQKFYDKLGIVPDKTVELQKQNEFQNDSYFINFYTPKSGNQIRERFYSKLVSAGIMKQQPRKTHQNLFIFDWDDTILCTSFLSSYKFVNIPVEATDYLTKIDDISEKLLRKCRDKQKQLYIITNAAKGWVEHSSKIYLPKVHDLLKNTSIPIISARSLFAELYPTDYAKWKIQAFKTILNNFDTCMITNLICIGDSNIEMEAAQSLGKQFQQSLVKTVKFKQNPKPDELIKQLELVCERMKQIYSTPKNLTIRLEKKHQKTV